MTRRSLTILLHWGTLLLVLAMIKGGSAAPVLRWSFVVAGGLWVGLALGLGLLGKPGPKLRGGLRTAYPWMHRIMYALVAVAVAVNLAALLGLAPLDWAWQSLLVILSASALHGLFHVWRHTALYDGALRMMAPRSWHKYL